MIAEPGSGVSTADVTPPAVLVIFGATGDLTSRMLMPALGALEERQELGSLTVVGIGRTELSEDDFAIRMGEAGDPMGVVLCTRPSDTASASTGNKGTAIDACRVVRLHVA